MLRWMRENQGDPVHGLLVLASRLRRRGRLRRLLAAGLVTAVALFAWGAAFLARLLG